MTSRAPTTIDAYLEAQDPERRRSLSSLRTQIARALPRGFVDVVQHGMLCWVVPLSRFAETYNGQPLAVLALAAQKQHFSLYMMGLYGDPELRAWFERAYAESGKRLDMGKSCLRFKQLDDLALPLVLEAVSKVGVDDMIAQHEAAHGARKGKAAPRARAGSAKPSR